MMWPSTLMLLVTLSSVLICNCSCCVESERAALLHIKESLNHPDGSFSRVSWGSHPDCCQWKGVECNVTTNRVVVLSLNYTRVVQKLWYLNSSMFLSFQDLGALYLHGNQIGGCLENEGFNKLSSLKNLQILDLGENQFGKGQALSSLNGISSLTYLDLSYSLDQVVEYRSFENLRTLKKLEFLDLSDNGLDNRILPYLVSISSLKTLHLSLNQLEGAKVFSSLRRLSSLKVLYLDFNRLSGSLLTEEVNALKNLEELYLRDNEIQEFISPQETTSLSKLKVLDLSNMKSPLDLVQLSRSFPQVKSLHLEGNTVINHQISIEGFRNLEEMYLDVSSLVDNFLQNLSVVANNIKVLSLQNCSHNGTLHIEGLCELKNLQDLNLRGLHLQGALPSCFTNLTSLRMLDISYNKFQIPNSFSPFMNNSKLRFPIANNNEVIPEAEPTFQEPPSRLQLYLFSSTYTSMKQLPQFLYSQNDLRILDLSNNNLTGTYPSWLLRKNSRLQILRLNNNFFNGTISLPLRPNPHLHLLDLAHNKMGGQVPQTLGLVFPNLKLLSLDYNAFEIGHLEIPSWSIERLSLSSNGLTGKIPSSFSNMKNLRFLDLSNNQLSGEVPTELISRCQNLRSLGPV